MAAWQSPRTPDEVFLLSEAPGFRSRGTVTLKAGAAYQAGTVLQAEEVGGASTGLAVPYADGDDAVVLCRFTDATDGAVEAAVIDADAEVKLHELTVVPAASAAAVTALAANGIKVR